MVFWIFAIPAIVLGIAYFVSKSLRNRNRRWSDEWNRLDTASEYCSGISVGCIIVAVFMLIVIATLHINSVGDAAALEARYDALVYQLDNDIYDNDNDLGKRELYKDVQDWNEMIARNKTLQRNFWIGVFVPDIYDQFELIEFKEVDHGRGL